MHEPFSGLWNRRGEPVLDGAVELSGILAEVGAARPYREKIGSLEPTGDDLIYVLPPGDEAPAMSGELLRRLVGVVDRGRAVLVWATDPEAIEGVRERVGRLACAGRG
jgi:hypothetical protein